MALFIDPQTSDSEPFRMLRTNMQYMADKDSCRVIMLTSARPGDGKTTVAANLAVSMAQAGEKVLLIDCDLRKPRCHRLFEVGNRQGLTNILVDTVELSEVVQDPGVPGLTLLTSGPIPPNPVELLASARMDDLLRQARDTYDHVLVDAPPAIPVADAMVLASKADGVILVLVAGVTRVDHAAELRDMLTQAQGRLLGVVLNKVRHSSSGYYYRYYYGRDTDERSQDAEGVR